MFEKIIDGSSSMEPFYPALCEIDCTLSRLIAEQYPDFVKDLVYVQSLGISGEVFPGAFVPLRSATPLEFPFGGGTPLDAALGEAARTLRGFYAAVYGPKLSSVIDAQSTILSDLYSGDGFGPGLEEYLAACKELKVRVVILGPSKAAHEPGGAQAL